MAGGANLTIENDFALLAPAWRHSGLLSYRRYARRGVGRIVRARYLRAMLLPCDAAAMVITAIPRYKDDDGLQLYKLENRTCAVLQK